jgi:hypothetical protein
MSVGLDVFVLQVFAIGAVAIVPSLWLLIVVMTPLSLATAVARVAATNLTIARGEASSNPRHRQIIDTPPVEASATEATNTKARSIEQLQKDTNTPLLNSSTTPPADPTTPTLRHRHKDITPGDSPTLSTSAPTDSTTSPPSPAPPSGSGALLGLGASVLSVARMLSPALGGVAVAGVGDEGPAVLGAALAALAVLIMIIRPQDPDSRSTELNDAKLKAS